jgi:hypothetical protein
MMETISGVCGLSYYKISCYQDELELLWNSSLKTLDGKYMDNKIVQDILKFKVDYNDYR